MTGGAFDAMLGGTADMGFQMALEEFNKQLDNLGVDRCHVSRFSFGSCVARELALTRPDAVQSLQLHGTWARADGYAGRKFRVQLRLLEEMDLRSFYEINMLWFITPEYMRRYPDEVERRIDSIVDANGGE